MQAGEGRIGYHGTQGEKRWGDKETKHTQKKRNQKEKTVHKRRPSDYAQMAAVWSQEPVARAWPSGETFAAATRSVWRGSSW